MRRLLLVCLTVLLLTGCSQPESYETVMDQVLTPVQHRPMQPVMELPGDAVEQVFSENSDRKVYFCDGFTLTLDTYPSGDLEKTLRQTTGFPKEQLDLIATEKAGIKHYVCAWSAAGEEAELICRMCLLDDGNYHYVLTAVAPAEQAGELVQGVWKQVFASFRLMAPEDVVNSGS